MAKALNKSQIDKKLKISRFSVIKQPDKIILRIGARTSLSARVGCEQQYFIGQRQDWRTGMSALRCSVGQSSFALFCPFT
jgi:hypothetical protein